MKRQKWFLALSSLLALVLTACPENIDTTLPTVTINAPAHNSSIITNTVTVTGTATDNVGVTSLEYTLNGGAAQSFAVVNPFSFTTTNLVVGNNVIVTTAKDAAGNKQTAVLNLQRSQPTGQFALNISKSGTGTGSVTSNPAGINCGTTCSSNYSSGSSVTLTATPASGSSFTGWSGACTGTNTCVVTMNAATMVTANFENTSSSKLNETEPNDTSNQAQAVTMPSLVTGSISSNTDTDYYSINATTGDWIKIDVDAQTLSPASALDSMVEILDSNGTKLASNNNTVTWTTSSTDSFVSHQFAASGKYLIKVSSSDNSSQGNYTLNLQLKSPTWALRAVGGSYREVNATNRTVTGRVSLELRDTDNPSYGPTGTYPLTIVGPSGWNNDQPLTTNSTWFGDYRDIYPPAAPDIAPINVGVINPRAVFSVGMYTAKLTVYGTEFTSTFKIDPSSALPVPEPVTLSNVSTTGMTATWSAVAGAVRYFTVLLDPSNNTWVASKSTTAPTVAFTGLSLSSSKQYRVDVNAYRDNGIEIAYTNGISFDQSANRNTFFTPASVTTDTTPPTVSLSSSSTNVTTASSITLTANANDNIGVAKVEFYDGSTKLGEDTTAPFEQIVAFTSANNGTKTYTAKAFDTANNSTSSTPVTVTINIPVPNFTLEPLYPQASSNYPVAQNADSLHNILVKRLNGFATQAQNFDILEFTGAIIGDTPDKIKVVFSKTLSSGDNLAFVLVGGASVPVGEYTVTVVARGGGITSSAATVKLLVTPCSSGC